MLYAAVWLVGESWSARLACIRRFELTYFWAFVHGRFRFLVEVQREPIFWPRALRRVGSPSNSPLTFHKVSCSPETRQSRNRWQSSRFRWSALCRVFHE